MRLSSIILLLCVGCAGIKQGKESSAPYSSTRDTIIIFEGLKIDRLSDRWLNALQSRMSTQMLDSFAALRKQPSAEEKKWAELIAGRSRIWKGWKDSLEIPFGKLEMKDTIYIMLGYMGRDDGFTYGSQTVCLDLSALYNSYGSAELQENTNRIDRIYAHEFTHLLYKEWAQKNSQMVSSFRDSILWECWYEGLGMYRSLSKKWLPQNGILPDLTKKALEDLTPVFVSRMKELEIKEILSPQQKQIIQANLSRGSVPEKWGAFPVGIWIALEAKGDDRNLIPLVSKGPISVLTLARKYLPPELRTQLDN